MPENLAFSILFMSVYSVVIALLKIWLVIRNLECERWQCDSALNQS